MTDLVVVGAGGFGREALDVVEAVGSHRLLGVLDDSPSDLNLERLAARGIRYLGSVGQWTAAGDRAEYLIAIGSPAARERVAAQFAGYTAATLVHPLAGVGSANVIGAGSIVCAGVQISTNVRIGRHVHLNPSAVVGHDTVIDDFVSVNPAATISGDVRVGQRVLVGAASVILQGLCVGADAVVGAAACVVRDVAPGATVKGVPAR